MQNKEEKKINSTVFEKSCIFSSSIIAGVIKITSLTQGVVSLLAKF